MAVDVPYRNLLARIERGKNREIKRENGARDLASAAMVGCG